MFVELKIPDTTALTALNYFKKHYEITSLKRYDYYEFEIEESYEKFKEKIRKVDLLVNHNKHDAHVFEYGKSKYKGIIVKEMEDECEGLMSVLKNRLGITEIKKMQKGTFWSSSGKISIEELAKDLLYNPNYQTYQTL